MSISIPENDPGAPAVRALLRELDKVHANARDEGVTAGRNACQAAVDGMRQKLEAAQEELKHSGAPALAAVLAPIAGPCSMNIIEGAKRVVARFWEERAQLEAAVATRDKALADLARADTIIADAANALSEAPLGGPPATLTEGARRVVEALAAARKELEAMRVALFPVKSRAIQALGGWPGGWSSETPPLLEVVEELATAYENRGQRLGELARAVEKAQGLAAVQETRARAAEGELGRALEVVGKATSPGATFAVRVWFTRYAADPTDHGRSASRVRTRYAADLDGVERVVRALSKARSPTPVGTWATLEHDTPVGTTSLRKIVRQLVDDKGWLPLGEWFAKLRAFNADGNVLISSQWHGVQPGAACGVSITVERIRLEDTSGDAVAAEALW